MLCYKGRTARGPLHRVWVNLQLGITVGSKCFEQSLQLLNFGKLKKQVRCVAPRGKLQTSHGQTLDYFLSGVVKRFLKKVRILA